MDKGKAPAQDTSAMMAQGIEQARAAMESYLKFFQNNMSAAPWAGTELNKKLATYAQQNVATAFKYIQELTKVKNPQDLVRIQTEFLQTQLKSLTEQAKDLGETATKAASGAIKGPLNPSS